MDERARWEQELRDRQRNIVFPDTVRNEGRFYRNIAYGTVPLTSIQRIGVVILGIPSFVCGLLVSASGFYVVLDLKGREGNSIALVVGGAVISLFTLAIGIIMVRYSWKLLRAAFRKPIPPPEHSA